jgi:hemoglobin
MTLVAARNTSRGDRIMTQGSEATSSLYTRLGGAAAVNAAVDLFYQKIMADPSLSPFFANSDMKQQRAKQKAFLTYAFGGAPNFSGRNMRQAHANAVKQGLGEKHFAAVAGHLQTTLKELGVKDNLIGEVMTIAASTHDDVLGL